MTSPAKAEFLERVHSALKEQIFVRLHLGAPNAQQEGLRLILIRPIELRGELHLSFTYRHATRDITKNYLVPDGLSLVDELLGPAFRSGFLSTTRETVRLQLQKGRSQKVVLGPPETQTAPSTTHDQPKHRALSAREPWLHLLGITDAQGKVCAGKEAKFRQIHRFVELLEHLIPDTAPVPERGYKGSSDDPVWSLVDMGCGKGYLTFAAHQFLLRRWGDQVRTLGIEQRPDLVQAAQNAARTANLDGLTFQSGSIDNTPLGSTQILVALHACNTATDDALARGLAVRAQWLIVAPCCHQEIRPQLNPPAILVGALQHGILRERQAELLTDAIRAGLLNAAGYQARVFEFISPEHTSKNLMITAVRQTQELPGTIPSTPEVLFRNTPLPSLNADQVSTVCEMAQAFGIEQQQLATHLGVTFRSENQP